LLESGVEQNKKPKLKPSMISADRKQIFCRGNERQGKRVPSGGLRD
jgi:hypothetical protein